MKVSVIIPSFNRPEWSVNAIKSVAEQTYKNWHLIFVDDGSTDNTHDRVKNYLSSINGISYSIIKTPNLGVSHARNIGIKVCNTEFISFLDCDDEWLPNKLETQITFLKSNPNLKWVYSDERWIRNNQPFLKQKQHQKFDENTFENCISRCFIGASTVLIAKDIFNDVGLFNESFPVCEDYDLWLRISLKYPVGFINQELIIKNGGHNDQLSTKYKAMDYWRIKALSKLTSKNLKQEHQILIKDFINKKAPFLIKGFEKYNNPKKLDEIKEIQKQVNLIF